MADVQLRPLSLGEVLDRTFNMYRSRFLLFVGIMTVPYGFVLILSILQQLMVTPGFGPQRAPTPAPASVPSPAQMAGVLGGVMVGVLLALVVYLFVFSVGQGATTLAVSELYMGRTSAIVAAYRGLKGQVGRLIWTVLSVFIRVFGLLILTLFGFGIVIGVIVAAATATGAGRGGNMNPALIGLLVLLYLLVVFGLFVLAVVLAMRYALAIPACILERVSARDAIRRSVALSKGFRAQIFLIFLLVFAIQLGLAFLVQLPVMGLMFRDMLRGQVPVWLAIFSAVTSTVVGMLSAPIGTIAISIFYYDMRVRKEAFDLEHMMSTMLPSSPAPAFSGPGPSASGQFPPASGVPEP